MVSTCPSLRVVGMAKLHGVYSHVWGVKLHQSIDQILLLIGLSYTCFFFLGVEWIPWVDKICVSIHNPLVSPLDDGRSTTQSSSGNWCEKGFVAPWLIGNLRLLPVLVFCCNEICCDHLMGTTGILTWYTDTKTNLLFF